MVVHVFIVFIWVCNLHLCALNMYSFVLILVALGTIQMSLAIPLSGLGVFIGVFYTAFYQAERITNRDRYAMLVAGNCTCLF
jgi:uncharacterized membrane protein